MAKLAYSGTLQLLDLSPESASGRNPPKNYDKTRGQAHDLNIFFSCHLPPKHPGVSNLSATYTYAVPQILWSMPRSKSRACFTSCYNSHPVQTPIATTRTHPLTPIHPMRNPAVALSGPPAAVVPFGSVPLITNIVVPLTSHRLTCQPIIHHIIDIACIIIAITPTLHGESFVPVRGVVVVDGRMSVRVGPSPIHPRTSDKPQSTTREKVRRDASEAAHAGGVRHGGAASVEATTAIRGFHARAARGPSTSVG